VHEGVRVMTETVAIRQDIRPLQIGLLNLMPNRIKTELQMARLLGASPLQVNYRWSESAITRPKTPRKITCSPSMRRGESEGSQNSTASSSPAHRSKQSL